MEQKFKKGGKIKVAAFLKPVSGSDIERQIILGTGTVFTIVGYLILNGDIIISKYR